MKGYNVIVQVYMNREKMMDRRDPTKNLARVLRDKYDYLVRVSTSPNPEYAQDADVVINGYDSKNDFPKELSRNDNGSKIFLKPENMRRVRSSDDLMRLVERIHREVRSKQLKGVA